MKLEPANDPEPSASVAPSRRPRPGWAWELLALFAILLGLDAGLRPDFALLDLIPHVFWIPVLAMAAFHGLNAGLAAASAATALLWWDAPRLSPALADHFAQWAHLWREPVLWLLAALLLGAHRDAERRRREEAEERAELAEHRSETVAAYAGTLRAHIAELEREVALPPVRPDAQDEAHPARVLPFARRQGDRKP